MTIEEMQHKLLSLTEDKVNLRKALEAYKKALELACNIIENHAYCPYMCDGNRECIDCLLQKAREE